jgi:cytidylate kinase
MDQNYIINIGRQLGSGGRQIGEILASQLGISFYDKELIQIASQESGLGKEFFEKFDEKDSHSLFGGLFGVLGTFSDEIYSNSYLNNETLFRIQSDVIRKLAEQKSCIFIGRCADYILKDYPRCLNVFVTANLEDRIKRVAEKEHITENKAKDLIEKTDKKRSGYYNYYSNKVWGAASSYHLCINSSLLGIDDTVTYILQLVKKKFETVS